MIHIPQRVFYLVLILVLITIAHFTIQLNTNKFTSHLQVRKNARRNGDDDISCHFDYSNDILPSAEDTVFGSDSIFFHETSCRGGLTLRQACVVESAARLHPNRSVFVLFSASVTEENLQKNCLNELRKLNVKFLRIHLPEYAEGTGLIDILMKQINKKSRWRIEHSSDILRIITLYKYGGVYLDTDTLVVKQLDALGKNWAAREDNDSVSNAAIAATEDGIGHQVMETILERIRKDYRPLSWTYNGPKAITRTLQKYCDKNTGIDKFSAEKCQGFEVYDQSILYPIPYTAFDAFFWPGRISNYNKSYAFHFWNSLSLKRIIWKDSLMHDLAIKHCPSIVNYFEDDFEDDFGM